MTPTWGQIIVRDGMLFRRGQKHYTLFNYFINTFYERMMDRRMEQQSNGRTNPPKEMQGASKNLMLDFLLQACVDFNIVIANVPGEIRSPPWYCSIILSKTYVLIYCDVYFDYFGRICISVLAIL